MIGLFTLVQGFEASRYIGVRFAAEQRISTMRIAQIISTVVFIVLVVPPIAAAGVLAGLVATAAAIVYLTATALVDEADQLDENLGKAADDIRSWLADTPIDERLVDEVSSTLTDNGPRLVSGLASGVLSAFNSATAMASGSVLSLFVPYYLLKDGPGQVVVRRASGEAHRSRRNRIADDVVRDVRGYVRGQTLIALSNGVVIGLAAAVLGVPAALAIGVVNFFGAYIPYLGGFFGGAFAVLMALGGGGVGLAVAMLIATLVVNLVLENFLQPLLIGGSLNIAPLPILLATTLGAMLAGLLGLILAAPVLAISLGIGRSCRTRASSHRRPGPRRLTKSTLQVALGEASDVVARHGTPARFPDR